MIKARQKGISAIIATIMLVMITVTLIATFYGWSTGLFSSISESVKRQTDISVIRSGMEFSIINAKNTSLTNINVVIRNSGTQNMDLDTLVAFVDNDAASDNAAGRLPPGNISSFNVISPFSLSNCDTHVLMISVAYTSDAYYVIKC